MSAVLSDSRTRDERLKLLRRVLDAAEAVAFAHSLGVVHRDIKPANIVLGEYGETQVVDWGLARAQGEPELEREMHGESATPHRPARSWGPPRT
ncbi:MAG: protein kinase [Proteobacteria bacterium]|nr:protein kinase [Pseudomonadota bacterium]MCP4918703.1 protein kinase [Pseudomonadota bacterium]